MLDVFDTYNANPRSLYRSVSCTAPGTLQFKCLNTEIFLNKELKAYETLLEILELTGYSANITEE